MGAKTWAALYAAARLPQPFPVLTGFNANTDRIIPVTAALLGRIRRQPGSVFSELFLRLEHSLRHCAADEMILDGQEDYAAVCRFFARTGTPALGGQAGIAAARLQGLGFGPVTCAVPGAGRRTRELLKRFGITPCTLGDGAGRNADPVHFVFEHSPGLVPLAPGTIPRNNRFIVSPAHTASSVLVPAAAQDAFFARIASCRRAFLSGYQYLQTEEEFDRAARQLARIRAHHPAMRTHVECTGGIRPGTYTLMARHIFPHADSLGLNEQELGMALRALGARDTLQQDNAPATPDGLVRDAVTLAGITGVPRLHLHTFGYYILVQKPGAKTPEASRNALLLAASEAATAVGGDHRVISPDGLGAYAAIRRTSGPEGPTGIFPAGERTVIVVPACISLPARKTTGLGDIISSVAFVADPF